MLDVNRYKPKVKNESDKYSWNLYRFLNKQVRQRDIGKYVKKQIKIYWLTHSRWDGRYLEFEPDNLRLDQLLISPFGGRVGYSLSEILAKGYGTEWSFPWKDDELIDITDWFFSTYERDGRCIFDRGHNGWMLGTDKRFTYVNNTRKCNCCGQWHEKEIRKVQTIERKVYWV